MVKKKTKKRFKLVLNLKRKKNVGYGFDKVKSEEDILLEQLRRNRLYNAKREAIKKLLKH